jgi:hypothetical protein
MPDYLQNSDDRTFYRLVDGELSEPERRQLLQSLDLSPDGWRRCALAFLEAQFWGQGLKSFVREPAIASQHESDANKVISPPTVHGRQHIYTWTAIAASLLVAASLAFWQRNSGPSATDLATNSQSSAQIASEIPDSAPSKPTDDAITFFVRDETGRQRPVRIPLMDAELLDREHGMEFQTGVPVEVRNRLQDRGYQVQSRRRYAPLMLENGHRMFVPVEDTKIVPVSQNVY